jgi:hypothetical protein
MSEFTPESLSVGAVYVRCYVFMSFGMLTIVLGHPRFHLRFQVRGAGCSFDSKFVEQGAPLKIPYHRYYDKFCLWLSDGLMKKDPTVVLLFQECNNLFFPQGSGSNITRAGRALAFAAPSKLRRKARRTRSKKARRTTPMPRRSMGWAPKVVVSW